MWINWNHLQFYKRNPFKNESDQKKVAKNCNRFPFYNRNPLKIFRENKKKIEITFNFTKEIPLKMNRTKKRFTKKLKSSSILKRKSLKKMFAFNFIREICLKIKNWNHLQFYKRNPFKILCLKFYMKNPFKIYSTRLQFYERNPFGIFSEKKLTLKFDLKNTL